jgi:hypothetical protein
MISMWLVFCKNTRNISSIRIYHQSGWTHQFYATSKKYQQPVFTYEKYRGNDRENVPELWHYMYTSQLVSHKSVYEDMYLDRITYFTHLEKKSWTLKSSYEPAAPHSCLRLNILFCA